MTTAYTIETLSAAITEAMQTTEPVEVHVKTIEGAIEAVDAALAAMPGEWDSEWEREEKEIIKVWAWTDETPEDESEFGLRIRKDT